VLHEVPEQVTSFYKSIKKVPNEAKKINNSFIKEAMNNHQGFTRTGTVMDKDHYGNKPQAVGGNLLQAFGLNPQAKNYGAGYQSPMPTIPENQGQQGGYYPMPPTSQQLNQNMGMFMANMYNKN